MAKKKKLSGGAWVVIVIAVILIYNNNIQKQAEVPVVTANDTEEEAYVPTTAGGGGGGGSAPYVPTLSWCYQETTNASSITDGTCALNYSGIYNTSLDENWTDLQDMYDGSILTYGIGNSTTYNDSTLIMAYVVPTTATNDSLWNVCDGNITDSPYCINLTLPTDCWGLRLYNYTGYDNGTQIMILGAVSRNDTFTTAAEWFCLNSSVFNATSFNFTNVSDPMVTLRYVNGTTSGRIYEESMWWRILS